MATEVLRPHNILLPPQRIRTTHRKPNPSTTRKALQAASTASRRHHGRPSSSAKNTAALVKPTVEVYAGPAFSVSPEPSSLPLPQFPFKKAATVGAVVDEAATCDLRRMLRLE